MAETTLQQVSSPRRCLAAFLLTLGLALLPPALHSKIRMFGNTSFLPDKNAAKLGDKVVLTLLFTSPRAERVRVDFRIPPQVAVVEGNRSWSADLDSNQSVEVSLTVRFVQEGRFNIGVVLNGRQGAEIGVVATKDRVELGSQTLAEFREQEAARKTESTVGKYIFDYAQDHTTPKPIPTDAKKYFSRWQGAFKRANSMNDQYFDSHISVIEMGIVPSRPNEFVTKLTGKSARTEEQCFVRYLFRVDWARLLLVDQFPCRYIERSDAGVVSSNPDIDLNSFAAIVRANYLPVERNYINKVRPVDHVLSRSSIEEIFRESSPKLGFDVNRDLFLNSNGELALRLSGKKEGHCFLGAINLYNTSFEFHEASCEMPRE